MKKISVIFMTACTLFCVLCIGCGCKEKEQSVSFSSQSESESSTKYCTVTFAEGDGYVLNGKASVTQGEDYTFTLKLLTGYTQSAAVVKVNGTACQGTQSEGVYTYLVQDIQTDLSITVEVVQLNQTNPNQPVGEHWSDWVK